MRNGLYAFPSASSVGLLWIKVSALGRIQSVQTNQPIDPDCAPDDGLRQAFATGVSAIGCPVRTDVVWVVPPDMAGVLCAPVSEQAELPLPFPEQDIRRVNLQASQGLSVILWVHVNWVALIEGITQAADLVPVALVSRAQWVTAAWPPAQPGVGVMIDTQAADWYLHACDPLGQPCRSTVLPGSPSQGAGQQILQREMAALASLFGEKTPTMTAGHERPLADPASLKQLLRIGHFQAPSVELCGKHTVIQRLWWRYAGWHAVMAAVLVAAVGAVLGWQHTRLAELTEHVDSLKPGSAAVRSLQPQAAQLSRAAEAILAFEASPDARQARQALFDALPPEAHVLKVSADLSAMEFDLRYPEKKFSSAEAFSLNAPGYGPPVFSDLGSGIAKYILQAQPAPTSAPSTAKH